MKKRIVKVLVLALALTVMTTSLAFAAAVPSDVNGQPYEEAVAAMMEKGIITGDVDGLFHPNDKLTRAQACKIVVSAIDPPATELSGTATQWVSESGFSDLKGYGWAADSINYAAATGITNGYPDGTFKPGNNVTFAEMITFIVRACGYTDQMLSGTWPQNYIAKAEQLGLLTGTGLVTETGTYPTTDPAEKWMMAWVTYNALEQIAQANPKDTATPPQGTDQDKAEGVPSTTGMTYVNGTFNANITTFDGKDISSGVTVYTYGTKKDYSKEMEFSNKAADYRQDTIYKYKNVKTPAWYKAEGGKITELILPMDVGFSGKAYGVINSTVQTLDGDGDAVTGFKTLTALQDITWLYDGKFGGTLTDQFEGEIFELVVSDGTVTKMNTVDNPSNKAFVQLAGTDAWVEVDSYNDNVITLRNGKIMEVVSNASVYVLNDDGDGYKAGKLSSIKKGCFVRLYEISDDDYTAAELVVVKPAS